MSNESVDSRPLSRGTVIAGRYEIEKYLGESLLGPTYIVKHVEQDTFLVLRFIRKEYKNKDNLEEMQQLLQTIREIKHPNMIRYGNMGTYQEMLFFTQEYFRSENLRAQIINRQADFQEFSVEEAFNFATCILEAMHVLHEAGVYHTTIKPENILLKEGKTQDQYIRHIKLNDIMTAAILGDKTPSSPYRPPECRTELAMNKAVGPAADVFSVGNVLYELLIGKPAKGTYLPPSQIRNGLSSEVDVIINCSLSFDPDDRYSSAKDMLDHIRRSVGEFVVHKPQSSNNLSKTALASAVMILLVFIGFLMMREDPTAKSVQNLESSFQDDEALRAEIRKAQPPSSAKIAEMNSKMPGMRYIPKGPVVIGVFQQEYRTGLTKRRSTDVKAHIENVQDFYIDEYEFPNQRPPAGQKPTPVTNISQEKAEELCLAQQKRLCTAIEWEKACRGPKNYIYSYGDTEDEKEQCSAENYDEYCQSDYGVYGLSSDAAEWTSTNPASSAENAIIKGGDIGGSSSKIYRCSHRFNKPSDYTNPRISFRCCKDVKQVELEEKQRLKELEEAQKEEEENQEPNE